MKFLSVPQKVSLRFLLGYFLLGPCRLGMCVCARLSPAGYEALGTVVTSETRNKYARLSLGGTESCGADCPNSLAYVCLDSEQVITPGT